mmetsp:Transcript_5618/g.22074  ORF Transcript_5618/g.22074 Transcript_5618/m.22074 type:complete len:244 (-) Transcript_5618:987-1718(-)
MGDVRFVARGDRTAFAKARPYAYASGMFENVRHVGHDLKVEDGGAWRRPTYESIVAAQGRGERRERDSSVESDHTTQSDACARKVVVEDDGPSPEAGVTCACCRTQKTPLWRNGPTGAKTLCNACGVRFKAGRVVCDEDGNVVTLAPQSRKRSLSVDHHERGRQLNKSNYAALHKRIKPSHSSFAYTHLSDARMIELQRVGDRGAKAPFPRVHSATILTDYDGAVLLMLLHDGEESEGESDED